MGVVTPSEAHSHRGLTDTLDHLAHLLPAQGPIGVFVHHNTLHAFQDKPFEEAVVEASKLFGTEPYMSEAAYRCELGRGRIQAQDIRFVLEREPNAAILDGRLDRWTLRRTVLLLGIRPISAESVEWMLEEGDFLSKLRGDLPQLDRDNLLAGTRGESEAAAVRKLFEVCRSFAGAAQPTAPLKPQRPRDGILSAYGIDLDDVIHPLLIRLCAVYLDQGQAYWPMPRGELGLLAAASRLLAAGGIFPEYLERLDKELLRQQSSSMLPEQVIQDALSVFGVGQQEWAPVLQAELLALPGWAGLMRRLEEEPELAAHERVPATLADYLALRLTLNKVAASNIVSRHRGPALSAAWRGAFANPTGPASSELAAAAQLMDVAQMLGLSAADLSALDPRSAARLVREIEAFGAIERRRLYHLAYERRHERLILSPIVKHARLPKRKPRRPAAQVFFCIDEREESMRRHLEETDPEVETFGAVGFFGVAVDYRGLDDAHGAPLCPVVVKPRHAVIERPDPRHAHLHQTRVARRRLWSQLARGAFLSSRTLVRGWFSAALLGLLSLFPLIARVLAPRTYARLRERLEESFLPAPRTELVFMRDDEEGRAAAQGLQLGFSLSEKIDRVASILAPIGLFDRFARIVVVLGHGSTSLNNPLESAYNCGACGGSRGGPNARLFAAMANESRVRAGLAGRDIRIPKDVWFVGGDHDSCTDGIKLFDLHLVPPSHRRDLERIQTSLRRASAANAHERSRRFEAAASTDAPEDALRHVEERSVHLAEPRPEYGHCTNAVCIVGRRPLSRGLFLDRRAFLSSYDASADPDDMHLTALLGGVVPVCAGINLEYYFSCVDNEKYGCGTKLPHNVTGLVGVMNGHASDLRTGLSSQMIEIHEPVRLLFVVETKPDRLIRAALRNELVTQFLQKRWIRMAALDPDTGLMHVYRDGKFEPYDEDDADLPAVQTSLEWYKGKTDHLPVARIEQGLDPVTSPMESCSA